MAKALLKSTPKEARVSSAPSILPPPLPANLIEQLLSAAMSRGGEFAEVYLEQAITTAVSLDERRIKSAQTGMIQGVGVRVISGAKVGYAYSDDLDRPALFRAARTAALIAEVGGAERSFKVSREPTPLFYR